MAKWQEVGQLTPKEINSMSRNELAKVVRQLSDVANKRLRRMEEKGISYGETVGQDVISGVKRFSTAGKSVGQLRAEYKRVSKYLKAKQSSLTGMKDTYKEFMKRMYGETKNQGYVNRKTVKDTEKMLKQMKSRGFSDDFYKDLSAWSDSWKIYNKLIETGKYAPTSYDSNQVHTMVYETVIQNKNLSNDEIYNMMVDKMTGTYEVIEAEREREIGDISDFFKISH